VELKDQTLPIPVSVSNDLALDLALQHLRRPFTAEAVKFKVQTAWQGGGMVVAYIDARLVIERLNAVAGGDWSAKYDPAGQGLMWCHLDVFGTVRSDIGAGQGQGSMATKATVSDALKRAAVHFGVGVSVYAMSRAVLDANTSPTGNQLKAKKKTIQGKEKWTAELTPGAEAWLREKYGAWLSAKGEPLFGPALDHGDEIGAQGADDVIDAPEPDSAAGEPAGEPVLRDERAVELTGQIEQVYAAVRKMNGAAYPPAKFRAEKEKASGSHEALEALLADLTRIHDEMKAARA
jgi:hypothetical protein